MKPAHRDVPGVDSAQRFQWEHTPAQPWRNGGGVTRELFAWPPGEAWQVRVSIADIERSGPFSAFPGVTRWFAVLDGEGVALDLPGGTVNLHPGDAARCFDGAAAPGCRLLDGPTRDLNLMLRQAEGGLQLVDDRQPWQPMGQQCGLFTPLAGQVAADDEGWQTVPAMSLWWWPAAPAHLRFRRNASPGNAPLDPASMPAWWLFATPLPAEALR